MLILPSDLKPIGDKAKGIHEHIARGEYVENEKGVPAVSNLAEDLRNVLLEYWVSAPTKNQYNHLVAETQCLVR